MSKQLSNGLKKSFISDMVSDCLLADAIEWIAEKVSIEDVYPRQVLEEWAANNGWVKRDIDGNEPTEHVRGNE